MVIDRKVSELLGRKARENAGNYERPGVGFSLSRAISEALTRSNERLGGLKNLAAEFDGRDGEVAISTVSRWISDPHRFPASGLLILARLDGGLRVQLAGALALLEQADSPVVEQLSQSARQEYDTALDETLLRMIHGPGGRGGSYQ